MRYALICAAAMLALVLLWPFAFASPAAVSSRPDLPAVVTMSIPAVERAPIRVARVHRPLDAPIAGGPSCFARYQQTYDACAGDEAQACRLVALDRWDVCETSGRWTD